MIADNKNDNFFIERSNVIFLEIGVICKSIFFLSVQKVKT